jgi:hypothetical protein
MTRPEVPPAQLSICPPYRPLSSPREQPSRGVGRNPTLVKLKGNHADRCRAGAGMPAIFTSTEKSVLLVVK